MALIEVPAQAGTWFQWKEGEEPQGEILLILGPMGAYVSDLRVTPDAPKHLAALLVQAAIGRAREQGAQRVSFEVDRQSHARMMEFAQKGWQVESVVLTKTLKRHDKPKPQQIQGPVLPGKPQAGGGQAPPVAGDAGDESSR